MLQVSPHPFYEEIKSINGNPKKFVEFIKIFMENFDRNYKLCKEWIEIVHDLMMKKINTENSLLGIVFDDFRNNNINQLLLNNFNNIYISIIFIIEFF
jgi:hypothetical protein